MLSLYRVVEVAVGVEMIYDRAVAAYNRTDGRTAGRPEVTNGRPPRRRRGFGEHGRPPAAFRCLINYPLPLTPHPVHSSFAPAATAAVVASSPDIPLFIISCPVSGYIYICVCVYNNNNIYNGNFPYFHAPPRSLSAAADAFLFARARRNALLHGTALYYYYYYYYIHTII